MNSYSITSLELGIQYGKLIWYMQKVELFKWLQERFLIQITELPNKKKSFIKYHNNFYARWNNNAIRNRSFSTQHCLGTFPLLKTPKSFKTCYQNYLFIPIDRLKRKRENREKTGSKKNSKLSVPLWVHIGHGVILFHH